ncbi:MAG TPA: cbb3-type cytochrome c oxidase N-terminal domain-containing protein [Candidatus Eisenbacteria bacterium]|jgi:cytochrome c oxidase cbb3-type subunit 3
MSPDEKDRKEPLLLDHNYDGIQEYDNPLPRWWLYLFFGTIAYSILYLLNVVPWLGTGKGRLANYEAEMAAAHARQAAAPRGPMTEAALLALTRDRTALALGREIFVGKCAPCHREDGGGLIGPNLTDDTWIHGGRPLEMLKTVNDGVPAKGMPTWSQVLKPNEVAAVVAYGYSLRGTHPPNPKPPEGTKLETEPSAAPGSSGPP